MSDREPFNHDPPYDLAVIVDGAVFRREAPVLLVFRDADGDWQFLSGRATEVADAKVVAFGEIMQMDPTLRETVGTPHEHVANRAAWGDSWRVEPTAAYLDRTDLSLNKNS